MQSFWIKYLTSCYQRIAHQMEEILNDEDERPEWMTSGRTVLCVKDPAKGNVAENSRPITCLPLMRKLMTGIIAESIHGFLAGNMVLPNEQKGCRRKRRGN